MKRRKSIDELTAKAATKPDGYLDACRRHGVVASDEEAIDFTLEQWQAVVRWENRARGHRVEASRPKRHGVAGRLWHAVVGLGKSALRIDRPADEVIEQRRALCRACGLRDGDYCGPMRSVLDDDAPTCGCRITNKTAVASESCPLDPPKWAAMTVSARADQTTAGGG